jgi:formyltetrahydrofolate deformylase
MTALSATLLVSCRDRTGLVAALSHFVFHHGGNITDADQHAESGDAGGQFFMRLRFDIGGFTLDRAGTAAELAALARQFELSWQLSYNDRRQRVAVMVSKTPHCLYDLLLRQSLGELGGDIVAVLSNHADLASVAGHFGLPFHHIPVEPGRKEEAEGRQLALLAELGVDLVVLARYMQVLSPAFVDAYPRRIINVHHSFLPAFTGARPYHAAFARGVKLIGATSHYVTAVLDEGPIIEQDVARISQNDQLPSLIQKGRDLERMVLSRAVQWHLNHRILSYANKTVIFA